MEEAPPKMKDLQMSDDWLESDLCPVLNPLSQSFRAFLTKRPVRWRLEIQKICSKDLTVTWPWLSNRAMGPAIRLNCLDWLDPCILGRKGHDPWASTEWIWRTCKHQRKPINKYQNKWKLCTQLMYKSSSTTYTPSKRQPPRDANQLYLSKAGPRGT